MAYAPYIAALVGGLGLYLMMPGRARTVAWLGALIGLGALGGLMIWMLEQTPVENRPSIYYYIFTVLAAAAAVKVIVHTRPVYSALYFVIVVLASSGLFLLLAAEFMVFAMIIIYAGAILVTYLFVIMLATLPASADQPASAPDYDRTAREPLTSVALGVGLLAVISSVMFFDNTAVRPRFAAAGSLQTAVERMPGRVASVLRDQQILTAAGDDIELELRDGMLHMSVDGEPTGPIELTDDLTEAIAAGVGNIDRIGLTLFEGHTLGIELAAVILLLAMVGAIVIAKRKVPEGESAMP